MIRIQVTNLSHYIPVISARYTYSEHPPDDVVREKDTAIGLRLGEAHVGDGEIYLHLKELTWRAIIDAVTPLLADLDERRAALAAEEPA